MLPVSILLFIVCVALGAFFSASETALIALKPYALDTAQGRRSKRAGLVRKILSRLDHFLATILIGNTLANAAAASIATAITVSLLPQGRGNILLATAGTTIILLTFSEFNPKIYAASHPLRLSLAFAPLIRVFMILFYPLVKTFTAVSGWLFPRAQAALPRAMSEEEAKAFLRSGIKGLPSHRRNMIDEIIDLGTRPVKEIMTPRPRIKAIEASASHGQILETVLTEGYSRFPVYRGRLDHVEGVIHTRDLIPALAEGRPFDLAGLVRKPLYVPESASVERVLLEMQARALHMAFVVDEFGNMDGLVTLEDILEEIVGDIRDESDDPEEAWFTEAGEGAFLIKGSAGVKEVNKAMGLEIPERADYTTLAGFILTEFGRIPAEGDVLASGGRRFMVEKMIKRRIHLVRVGP